MKQPKIQNGYFLKPRRLYKSQLAHKPPHIRETYDWLIYNANWQDDPIEVFGIRVVKGQVLTTCKDIQDGLSWRVGRRTEKYSLSQIHQAIRSLRNMNLITSRRTNEGLLIDITNYIREQNPNNYKKESISDNNSESNYESDY